jgi:putative copper export protein
VAAGAWTGALFGYWVGARASDANTQLSIRSAQALSTLATWSVLILIASGIYLAYEGLGHSLYHLWYSSYGRVLSLKVEIFAVVLAVGAYNRVYLMPTIDKAATPGRLLRNVAAESLVIIGVMGLAALLASTPPARMSVSMLDAREAHVDRKVLRDRESEPRVIQWLRNAELYFQES